MKNRLTDILNGIADGLLPGVSNSITKTNEGREVNRARLTAAVLSWLLAIALLKGWITISQLAELIKLLINE